MEAAGSKERFEKHPLGRWISGDSFIVWTWSARLGGVVAWGEPTEHDISRMFVLVDAYHRAALSCDVVTDVSRVRSLSSAAFDSVQAALRARLELYRSVPRHAIIRAPGLMAAATEGIFPMLGSAHNVRTFDEPQAAFGWVQQPEGRSALEELGPLIDRAMGVTPELRGVREYLLAHLRSARVSDAAKALGVSERTLHRTLSAARTGFRDELAALRVAEARRLLVETDRKIDAIARAVGFASHAHLATCFRRTTGETPSEYRARVQSPVRP